MSVISWRSVLLVEKTWAPSENHWPAANHWQACSHHIVIYWTLTIILSNVVGTWCRAHTCHSTGTLAFMCDVFRCWLLFRLCNFWLNCWSCVFYHVLVIAAFHIKFFIFDWFINCCLMSYSRREHIQFGRMTSVCSTSSTHHITQYNGQRPVNLT
jgi:hypothetical protein